jgi:hypothetical protein
MLHHSPSFEAYALGNEAPNAELFPSDMLYEQASTGYDMASPIYDYQYMAWRNDMHPMSSRVMHVNPADIEGVSTTIDLGENYVLEPSKLEIIDKPSRRASQPIEIEPSPNADKKTLKRLRNRVSASRCRTKKKAWITDLEEKCNSLKEENWNLLKTQQKLEEDIALAKNLIKFHKIAEFGSDSVQGLGILNREQL